MSLRKKTTITEKRTAASRRNGSRSRGPTTVARRKTIDAAHSIHGFCADAEDVAMRALGEDPEKFQQLLQGLWKTYRPADAAQEGLVIRLARATWLMNRADRTQEGCTLRQARDVNSGRLNRLHAQMMRLRITADSLRLLARSVERPHYVTPPGDLEKMKSLHEEGVLQDMGEIALALFYQLQAPGTGSDGVDPQEAQRRVLARIKDIFGLNSETPPQLRTTDTSGPAEPSAPEADTALAGHPPASVSESEEKRYPNITPAEWEARQRPRQLLENILKRQAEACEEQRNAILKESVEGPSPYERAAEIASTDRNTLLLRRMQDSYFREVRRVTNMLLKLKRYSARQ
ncbi:MAG: hypothetical protein ACLQVG_25355 [Terriglobia bacterium]